MLEGESGLELFNLKEDIGETTDIAKQNPEKTKELEKILDDWLKETASQLPVVRK